MAVYKQTATGPDAAIIKRKLRVLPFRDSEVLSDLHGISTWWRVSFSGSGSRFPSDASFPEWDDAANIGQGLFVGGAYLAQNGGSLTVSVEFAGRMTPYQLVWTRRTSNTTAPASPIDEVVTTDFLAHAGAAITLTAAAGKKVEMLVGGAFSQVNYFGS